MKLSAENIRLALSGGLRGRESHLKMLPTYRTLSLPESESRKLRPSSVLLLLYVERDELFACLIKRPFTMKHHAGQIALPGGRIDPGETAIETALRETSEEIGIKPEQIEILGSLTELEVGVSGYLIYPFVGWLTERPFFTINRDEVEKTIRFPLVHFRNRQEEVELETRSGRMKVPCFRYENEIIWGATAMILSEFYDVLDDYPDIFRTGR